MKKETKKADYYNRAQNQAAIQQKTIRNERRVYLTPQLGEHPMIRMDHHPGESKPTKGMLTFVYIVFLLFLLVGICWCIFGFF